jgi:PAS domain S-box-containing protein
MPKPHDIRWRFFVCLVFLFILIVCGSGIGLAETEDHSRHPIEDKKILILNAYEDNVPGYQLTENKLSKTLESGGVLIKNQFHEHLDLRRNPGLEHRKLMKEMLRRRYSKRHIDLVITLNPDALKFFLDECLNIFPDAPVLALYLPKGFDLSGTNRRIIPHTVPLNFRRTIEIALKLLPETRHVYVVNGTDRLDKWLEDIIRQDAEAFKGRLEFHYLSQLPAKEIANAAHNAPSNSILLITVFTRDVTGKPRTAVEMTRMLAPVSRVPIFGTLDTLLGAGIVGGSLLSLAEVGRLAGREALILLSGTMRPEDIPDRLEVPQLDMFDWPKLKYWNLSESDLPEGSIVVNREFSLWDFKVYIIGALFFIMAQSFLIVVLLWHRRRRRSAEEDLKTQLQFETMVSEISTGFINLTGDQIDTAIQDNLTRICDALDLDFAALWQVSHENPDVVYLTHFFRRLKGPELPDQMDAQGHFPWCLKHAKEGRVVSVSTEGLPPEAARDQEMWRHYGIKSSLVFPLYLGGSLMVGALSLNTMREERIWPEKLKEQLQLLAQVFANAIGRKKADHSLRESEARLELATNAAEAGLWAMYLESEEIWLSKKARELSGFEKAEKLTYQMFFDQVHKDDHEIVRQAVRETLETGQNLKCDFRMIRPDGNIRWMVFHGQRYPVDKPVCLMGVVLDITDRLKTQEESRERWKQLAHVTRIGSMGELTTSLAHEINQPLTAIQTNTEAALRYLSQSTPGIDEVTEILADVIRNNRRAGKIVKKVRALSKKETTPYTILDLTLLIEDCLSLIRADSLLRGSVIVEELKAALPPVSGDRVQLQQVIINMILNGMAAMKDTPSDQRKLVVRTELLKDRTVKVSIMDSGTGIDADHVEKLFEPFHTTKPDGMGMGLAISRTIIEEHGGTIDASNIREGGAVFAFTLPVYEGDQT